MILSSSEIHNIYHVVHKAPDYFFFQILYHVCNDSRFSPQRISKKTFVKEKRALIKEQTKDIQ